MGERYRISWVDIADYVMGAVLLVCIVAAALRPWGDAKPVGADKPPVAEPHVAERPVDPYDAHMKAASLAHATGDLDLALKEFTAAIEANPEGFEAHLTRGVVHQQRGDWQAAMDDYQRAQEIDAGEYTSWNNIATLLAACPDDSMRDGSKAVAYAQRACENTEWEEPATWHSLAVAYAELGDWPAATDIFQDQLGKVGDGPMAAEFRELLDLFKQEKPYRLKEPEK